MHQVPGTSVLRELHAFCLQGRWLLHLLTKKVHKIPWLTFAARSAGGHAKTDGGKAKRNVKPLDVLLPKAAPTWVHTRLSWQLPL